MFQHFFVHHVSAPHLSGQQRIQPAMSVRRPWFDRRLNPFSTLPCYGIEYWPKDAKLIQVGHTMGSKWWLVEVAPHVGDHGEAPASVLSS